MTRRWACSRSGPSASVRGRLDSRTWRERRSDVCGCYVTDPLEHPEPELEIPVRLVVACGFKSESCDFLPRQMGSGPPSPMARKSTCGRPENALIRPSLPATNAVLSLASFGILAQRCLLGASCLSHW
jgi:hypothetical protein